MGKRTAYSDLRRSRQGRLVHRLTASRLVVLLGLLILVRGRRRATAVDAQTLLQGVNDIHRDAFFHVVAGVVADLLVLLAIFLLMMLAAVVVLVEVVVVLPMCATSRSPTSHRKWATQNRNWAFVSAPPI